MCVASGGGRTRVDASAHGPVDDGTGACVNMGVCRVEYLYHTDGADDGTGACGIWVYVVYSTTRTARMTGRVRMTMSRDGDARE